MSTSTGHTTAIIDPTETVVVRAWPLVDAGAWSIVAIGGLLLVATAIGMIAQHAGWAVAATLILLAAGWRLLVPIYYTLSADGVTQSIFGLKRHLRWRAIGSFRTGRQGILLLHAQHPIRFDTIRGLYIPWHDRRAAVLALVQEYLDQAGAPQRADH